MTYFDHRRFAERTPFVPSVQAETTSPQPSAFAPHFARAQAVAARLSPALPVQARQWAKRYMTIAQAQYALLRSYKLFAVPVVLTKAQMKAVAHPQLNALTNPHVAVWRTEGGQWFIYDQVSSNHVVADIAVALDPAGKLIGCELLEYREIHGPAVGSMAEAAENTAVQRPFQLGQQIGALSGAAGPAHLVSLGVERIRQIWEQVIKHV